MTPAGRSTRSSALLPREAGAVLTGLLVIVLVACSPVPRQFSADADDARAPLHVTLVDETGLVRGIESLQPIPDWALRAQADDVVIRENGQDSVAVRWLGGTCPTSVVLGLSDVGGHLALAADLGAKCDSDVGKIRVVVIEFDRNITAASIEPVVATTRLDVQTPSSSLVR